MLFGDRELHEYPPTRARVGYLALTVLITVGLYYMAYCGGSVSLLLLADLHISFTFFVVVTAIGNVVGAFGAWFAGLTDRIGRVHTVIFGLLAASLMTAFALPNAHNRFLFAAEALIVGNIEGIVLVATPALIRDFSPQLSRARAMGFWTIGPVVGSLIVSVVGTLTIHGTPPVRFWGHEYVLAGSTGLVITGLAFLFLRELAPELRDQLMVSTADRVLVEVRARGLDVEASMRRPFRQMIKPDIVVSGFAVAVLLLSYYAAVGFGTIIFETVFGFDLHQANSLGNWTWGVNALTVVAVGIASDRLLVRKPFMVAGGVIAAGALVAYLSTFGHHPGYTEVAVLVSVVSFGLGVAYTPWMASFTETVEARNPALTATGLAVWGAILRVVVFVSTLILPAVVTSVTAEVDFVAATGTYSNQLNFAAAHPALVAQASQPANLARLSQLAALARSDPSQLAGVEANAPALATLTRFGPEVAAVAAHPDLFRSLAADPANGALQSQAVAALGGGATGQQRLSVLAANSSAIVPALTFAASHPQLVAFAQANAGVLGWAAAHEGLVAQATRYSSDLQALARVPPKILTYAAAHGPAAARAERESPRQWQHWYWVCFAGALFFLACVPLLRGRWRPRAARADEAAHEELVRAELAGVALASGD